MDMVESALWQGGKLTFSNRDAASRWKMPTMTLSVLLAMPLVW
jgi:hypothetical protein